RDPQELSWGEAALLAVLPNAPSLIHPGKNRDRLKAKRDKLLDRLQESGTIDAFTCSLAKDESIPEDPQPLPRYARHLLARASSEGFAETKIHSTVQTQLQIRVEQIIQDHHQRLKANQVFNAAAIVVEVSTGNVLAYVGNTEVKQRGHYGDAVDIINSPRSTGSILKPFLFAAMLDEGKMLPRTLQPDVPTIINGFAPKNFSMSYDGAVPADKALIRSLNIPAVHELRSYRYEKFHSILKNIGISTLDQPADHYGLSLILGGAEGTLWDISGMYTSMARTLNNFFQHPGKNKYSPNDFHPLNYLSHDSASINNEASIILEENSILSASSIYQTFDVLREVYRPGEETGWKYFNHSKKIAWKTGTSFGFRDAWAIGVTPGYVVGVWVGNADGEGRPGLTGTEAASPVMFDIFSQLPNTGWFQQPTIEMEQITICTQSGHRNTPLCNRVDTVWITKAGLQTLPCPYHKKVHLSSNEKFQLHSECESLDRIKDVNWFVLPPAQEYYYRQKNASYKILPPFRGDCIGTSPLASMDLIYPKPNAKIFIPRELDGKLGSAVFELAHRNNTTTVYWHLDGHYVGSTQKSHRLALKPTLGKHKLTLVDEKGESLEELFEVL
nr:penicillin-binding transpeptidase domain-containing protein [Chryseolinea sp.]